MLMRLFLIALVMMFIAMSCKKETVQPDPIPGRVIIKQGQPVYAGYIETTLEVNHYSGDTSLMSLISLAAIDSIKSSSVMSINSINFERSGSSYSIFLTSSDMSVPFLSWFRSIHYSGIMEGTGSVSMTDQRPLGNFSNKNTVPLNFSKSTGYSFTLANVVDCDYIEARIFIDNAYRNISKQSPSFKFYDYELLNSSVGSTRDMGLSLISIKDTLINNRKFGLAKSVRHIYRLTHTN